MSALKLYRGPVLELIYRRRQGSPFSVTLLLDRQVAMHATPSDFHGLLAWLELEAKTLREFMQEPEDPTVTDNMRGDQE
jgi:hypothetical protein